MWRGGRKRQGPDLTDSLPAVPQRAQAEPGVGPALQGPVGVYCFAAQLPLRSSGQSLYSPQTL